MRRFIKRILTFTLMVVFLGVSFFSLPVTAAPPTEDFTPLQWAITGPYGLHVPDWNDPSGNMDEETIVAVIDGAVDYTHPDLQGIVYEFSEEEQEALGCSRYGYDATGVYGTTPGADYHATHVAGIIGASWDGEGTSGICSNVKIISINCAVGDDTPLDYCLKAYDFVIRALDYGIPIRVINNSWGNVDSSLAMNALVEEAGRRGALSVFAAGNYADDLECSVFLPGAFLSDSPYAVVVGSIEEDGSLSDFSNYGETIVDIFAPGGDILSLFPMSGDLPNAYYEADGYAYMSGTSMATPAVSGGAAYLAGNHPEITDAASLKELLLSCVSHPPALDNHLANGALDLSVDKSGDYAPVITFVDIADDAVTVQGAHFGAEDDLIELFDAANGDTACEIGRIIRNDGSVSITLPGDLPPVIRVYVERGDNGKHNAALWFVHTSDNVYPSSYPLPEGDGLLDEIDSMSDYQAAGFLGGFHGSLYYLPLKFLIEDVILGFDRLYAFHITTQEWTELAPLPERVVATQALLIHDGILVVGTDALLTKPLSFFYDIRTDTWTELDASALPLLATPVAVGNTVLLVGGAVEQGEVFHALPELYVYDYKNGACTKVGSLAQAVWGAQVLYDTSSSLLYVYGTDQLSDNAYRQYFQIIDVPQDLVFSDAQEEALTSRVVANAFPAFRKGEGNRRAKFNVALHGALVVTADELYLVGPLSDDGTADTYRFDAVTQKFVAVGQRLSDLYVIWPAACAYRGELYAIARSQIEPSFRIFRSMPVTTGEEENAIMRLLIYQRLQIALGQVLPYLRFLF